MHVLVRGVLTSAAGGGGAWRKGSFRHRGEVGVGGGGVTGRSNAVKQKNRWLGFALCGPNNIFR